MAIVKPHTFADSETIDAARQNANFDEVYTKALDKTGDTITGNIAVDNTVTIDGVDISVLDAAVTTLDAAVAKTAANETITGEWEFDEPLAVTALANAELHRDAADSYIRIAGGDGVGEGGGVLAYGQSHATLANRVQVVASGGLMTTGYVRSATAQPGFLAYNTVTDSADTMHTVDFDTEEYDLASNFSGDTFTAPVTGYYLLCTNVQLQNSVASANLAYVLFAIAGTGARQYDVAAVTLVASGIGSGGGCVIAHLVAGNTVTVMVASASNTAVIGSSSGSTTFSGRLLA